MTGKYALIIANTEYNDPGLSQLSAPGKDAEEFARVLKSPAICGFDEVKVVLNQNESFVREAIDEFFEQKKPDDLLTLYFSGHGVRDELGSLYLAVKNTNRYRLRSTAIKSDFIRETMDQSRSKRQVLILDCCNSGAFTQGAKAATGVSLGTASAFEGGYGRIILTASDATQFAWEGNNIIGETGDSLFTHYLVEGLEGEADLDGDGCITVDELYDYAYEKVKLATPKQTPSKFSTRQQGEIILRQNIRIEDARPISLPDDLVEEMEDTRTYVREVAVQKLEKILKGRNLGMARSAKKALEDIAGKDDSRRVSQAALQILEILNQEEKKADEERKAKEEAERLAALKAGEERLAYEKAEAERKARDEAKKLARTRAEREAAEQEAARIKAEREATEKVAREKEEKEIAEREAAKQAKKEAAKLASQKKVEQNQRQNNSKSKLTITIISGVAMVCLIGLILIGVSTANLLNFQPTPTAFTAQTLTSQYTDAQHPTAQVISTQVTTEILPIMPIRVGEVTDLGGIDDKSFNATAYAGVEKAVLDFGVEGKYLESQQQSDYAKNIQQFLDEKTDLIVTVGFLLGVDTATAAKANPNAKFAIVDYYYPDCFGNDFVEGQTCGSATELPNVLGLTFQTDQAGFLAGYAAAAMTKTGKVATFGGLEIPPVTIFMTGFKAGVEYYNAQKGTTVEVLPFTYTGNFESTDDGRAFADSFVQEGADIIMPVAGPVSLGSAAFCQESNSCKIIGVDTDWTVSAPEYSNIILTSVMKNTNVAVYDAIKAAANGTFTGGVYFGTLANNGVGIATVNGASPELLAELEQLKADIISGAVKVNQ